MDEMVGKTITEVIDKRYINLIGICFSDETIVVFNANRRRVSMIEKKLSDEELYGLGAFLEKQVRNKSNED